MSEHDRIVAALTAFDNREARKRGYNRYAFAQYLLRLDEIEADVAAGASWRAAIIAAFGGRLRDACLRAIGEPKATADEDRAENLRPWAQGYVPVSER